MKIICVVKYVPDVDNFNYDYEKDQLVRQGSRKLLNPDDATAIGYALKYKKEHSETFIEVVTMAPISVVTLVEDLLRIGVDKATVLSDKLFAGSDTLATSKIIAKYLSSLKYDCILSGSYAVDGDTAHIPSQLAGILQLNQMSNITKIDVNNFNKSFAIIEVEDDISVSTYKIELPAILSLTRDSGYRLPYVRYDDLEKDVKDRVNILSNEELKVDESIIGERGSLTRVIQTKTKKIQKRSQIVVGIDDEGIETVYDFLTEKGFV